MLEASGVSLSDESIQLLLEHTEGWAAGLRLAALSLARHPEPAKFVAEFSGSERMIADYLLAEVLERQPERVRRLLLRTSILDRVNGALADLMVGEPGSEAILQELEDENAFVISIDASRSWFRYHQLLAELLQLELRKREPAELRRCTSVRLDGSRARISARCHSSCSGCRRLDAGGASAFRLMVCPLSRWSQRSSVQTPSSIPGGGCGRGSGTSGPYGRPGTKPRIAGDSRQYLALASAKAEAAPEDRRERLQVVLAALRLSLARQRGDVPRAIEEAQRALEPANVADAARLGLGEDLRALTFLA